MLKELGSSFKAILYERIVSPLSGAFIISWLILNWKIVTIVILGNTPILDRIKVIEENYLSTKYILLNPILSTLFLVIVYPWLSNVAYWIWQSALSFKVKTKMKFEASTPLSLEQSIELRKELQRKDLEFAELLAGKNGKIKELEANIIFLNNEINTKQEEIVRLASVNAKPIQFTNQAEGNGENDLRRWHDEYVERIDKGTYMYNHFSKVIDETLGQSKQPLEDSVLRYFIAAEIVDKDERTGTLFLTKKGKYFANLWSIND